MWSFQHISLAIWPDHRATHGNHDVVEVVVEVVVAAANSPGINQAVTGINEDAPA